MSNNSASQSLATPVKSGIVTGLVYSALIYVQNQFFASNPTQFAVTKLIFYIIILGLIFYGGIITKKQSGGFITFQEALKSMLLIIVIAELFYLIFSTIYVTFINPDFFVTLKNSWQNYFIKNQVPQEKIDQLLQRFNDSGKITVWSLVQSYGFSIIIDAIFACIFAVILKKQQKTFDA